MTVILTDIALFLLNLIFWMIIIQAILSWLVAFNVINMSQPQARSFVLALDRLVDPLYRPIRKILPNFGGIDFSPLIVLLAINLLTRVLTDIKMQALIAQ